MFTSKPAPRTNAEQVRSRYRRLASCYELTLGERLLYADTRRAAIDQLGLTPGATVIDVACGTGLNFSLLQQRITPTGHLIGIDLTESMLARARARVSKAGYSNVTLLRGDITETTRNSLIADGALRDDEHVDAVICTLGMSVIPEWEAAWSAMLGILSPGGRAALMDGSPPAAPTLTSRLIAPLVWIGCRWFAADWTRRPWQLVERDLDAARVEWADWGYLSYASGTKSAVANDHA